MSPSTHGRRAGKRVPELRLPYPLLEELLLLPDADRALMLRLMMLAIWTPTVTDDGIRLDAGEALISYRSRAIWDHVRLRPKQGALAEAGRVSLMSRILRRLEKGGFIECRSAQRSETKIETESKAGSRTRPTIVRFLKFRDILWPRNVDSKRETERGSERPTKQGDATIPSPDPASPADSSERLDASRGAARATTTPRLVEVTGFQQRLAAVFLEVKGTSYKHAHPAAEAADSQAAIGLLRASGDPDHVLAVWRWSLRNHGWPEILTVAHLARHWAELAPRAVASPCGAGADFGQAAAPRPSGPEAGFLELLGRQLRSDVFLHWFVPLHASSEGDELVLTAPDQFHQAFLNDNYREHLDSAWRSHRGLDASETGPRVRILSASSQATRA